MTGESPSTRLYFNRVVPDPLIDALSEGGPFHGLVELTREPLGIKKAVDLQLRADGKKPTRTRGRATLYIGLTKAFDLWFDEKNGFRIKPQTQFGSLGTGALETPPIWTDWLPVEKLEAVWDEVLAYARETINVADRSYIKTEGWMQAALSASEEGTFTVIDRESRFGFDSKEARKARVGPIKERLEGLKIGDGTRLTKVPSFGDELDALAIDDRGRVLIIEVKPGTSIPSLFWTPAQVTLYHQLFSAWAREEKPQARTVLEGMIEQRERIGLGAARPLSLESDLDLVPVIAVGGEVGEFEKANELMPEVWRSIVRAGISDAEPEVWQFDENGSFRSCGIGDLRRTPLDE